MNEDVIRWLNFLVRTYDDVTKNLTKVKNRLGALSIGREPKNDELAIELESIKGKISRRIEKELVIWPVWNLWLKDVPGIGPWIAAKLIMLYYYAFIPICPVCGADLEKFEGAFWCLDSCRKSVKGDGNLTYRMKIKDFPNISKWWAYMGRRIDEGKMVKRKRGVQGNWSTEGRTLGFHIGDAFIKQGSEHLYKKFYDERKRKREQTHPDVTKNHRHQMASNEMVKLFLAHFWVVARTIDNLPITQPYAHTIMGHTNYIEPFYWDNSRFKGETRG